MSELSSARAGYRQVEHTADLALELWAPSEEELLRIGARAIVAELTEQATVASTSSRTLTLETLDAGDRLVQWLNEVIVLALTEGFLCAETELTLSAAGLSATVHGEADAADRICQELKSATYHLLRIGRDEDGVWRAQVIIDV